MTGFSGTWLAAREPADHEARSGALAEYFARLVGDQPVLLDLACGTGSNIRYLVPRLGRQQRWIGLDHDAALLDEAERLLVAFAGELEMAPAPAEGRLLLDGRGQTLDIRLRERDLARGAAGFSLDGVTGLTASALLDLTSADWLESLAKRIRAERLPALFALNFDGGLEFNPPHELDDEIRRRFVAHQRTDKGFGPALGPDAIFFFAERLRRMALDVTQEASDWRLGHDQALLLRLFIEGQASALAQQGPLDPPLQAWFEQRLQEVADGRLELVVGHQDLLVVG